MKTKLLFAFVLFCLSIDISHAQVSITNAAPTATVNFSNTMQTTVGTTPSTAYEGDGFALSPTAPGRLNSNAWEIKGWSFGDVLFGSAGITVDDLGRGSVNGGVITPGMYAFTDFPGTVANPAMMIQPGAAGDFQPGTIALRIKNNGTSNMTQLSVNYNAFVRNDENNSSALNFSHSADNIVYVNEPALNYTSPDVADAFQWVNIATAPSRTCIINGLNIPPGGFYYIRWSVFNVSGTGDSDEFGLDDIVITGTYGTPAPEINVTCYGNTLLSGDITPTVGEGTDFAPSYAPQSTLLTTLQITYTVQNLGGLPLNISSVTITGANASDFTLSAVGLGNIAAASGTISFKSFTVIFDPSDEGLRTATVNIFSNDGNENPYTFNIQGYGIIPIPDIRINGGPTGGVSIVSNGSMIPNINNNTLYSPAQVVGGPGMTNGFEIRNDCLQNAPLLLTGASPYITISGANPSDFTLMTFPTGNSIIPGAKKQFTIKFVPTASGIRNAIVSIASNDPDENPYTFLIQGTGVAPEIDIKGNAQPIISGSITPSLTNYTSFDNVSVASGTLERSYTVLNTGNTPLTIGALTLTGANATDFSIVTLPATVLAVGGATTFTIRFDPSAVGIRNAVVNLINNDSNESPYTFAIDGNGADFTPCAFGTIETIAIQDFEPTPGTPTWTAGVTGTSVLAGGTAFGATSDAGGSTRSLGTRSVQVINGTATILMGNINTLNYNDIEMNFRLASLSVTAAEGSDIADKVVIYVSTNGGTTWSNEMEVLGNTQAKWSFTSGIGQTVTFYDGNNVANTVNTGTGYLTTDGFSNVSIFGLPKVAALAVRIVVNNNSINEIWALDNIAITGRKELSTTWLAGSWSAGAPTSGTKVVIDGDYNTTANGNINACQCQIKAGRNVVIGANNFMNIQSDLDNSGTLTIENNGSLVQQNDFASNLGAIKAKRYTTQMVAYDYTYWSSPVIGQTLFAVSPTTRFDKYFSFSPTIGNWVVSLNGAAVMQPGKGYIIRAPDNFTSTPQQYTGAEFNGTPNNGIIQTPIVIGTSNMNLLGNPYPSAIDANAFLAYSANVGVVEGTIYLWTHNTPITNFVYQGNDYAAYNFSGSVATAPAINPGLNNNTPSRYIASGQGFFIKGLSNGNAVFKNSMRSTGNNTSFFRNGNLPQTSDSTDEIERNRVWLNLTNAEGAFKQTLIGYIEGATNDYDRGFDGELYNANTHISLYSILNNTSMAILGKSLAFNENDKVVLGYHSNLAGVFEISIDHLDGFMETQNIYLEDKLLNVIHDLKQSAYSFETAIGTFDTRFELRFNNTTLSTNPFEMEGNAVIVTTKNKQIDIFSQEENMKSVTVYDILGRNIFEDGKVHNKKLSIPDVVSNQQALIVRIVLENGQSVTKKIVL